MANRTDFILPDLGEGVHEAEVKAWRVNVGDEVEEMQILAEMETDKALVEVPSPFAGKVVALHGEVGQIVHVGNPIVTFENAMQGGRAVEGKAAAKPQAAHAVSDETTEKVEQTVATADEAQREDAGTVVGSMEGAPTLGAGGKVMATPAVRRLAKELGVEIETIRGTGRGGRVTAADVEAAAESGARGPGPGARNQRSEVRPQGSAQSPGTPVSGTRSITPSPRHPPTPSLDGTGTAETIPFRGVRRKIAEALDRSVKTAVHFTVMDTAGVTQLDRIRRQQAAASGEKVSFLPFIMQAVCRGLKEFPQLNAVVDDEKGEIYIKGVIHMGVAVDTEHGLMVPVIRNADRLGILPLGRAVAEVAEKCRNRTITPDELRGGTFTVSNVGSHGGSFATPIINYPEVAILGVGRAKEAVMVRDGGIHIGLELPLSLSCDHRVVDGVLGARLLGAIVRYLQSPEVLLEPAGR